MAFNINNFARISDSGNAAAPSQYSYYSDEDNLLVITGQDGSGPGYFNDLGSNYFKLGDIIYLRGANANTLQASGQYIITQNTLPITIAAYTINADSVKAGDVANSIGLIEVCYQIDVAGGTSANYDKTVNKQFQVNSMEFFVEAAGDVSDTVELRDGSDNVIIGPEAIDIAQYQWRTGNSLNPTNRVIAAGGVIRVNQQDTAGDDAPPMKVIVKGFHV